MSNNDLDNWFCSLSIKQKNHIATKLAIRNGIDTKDALYPNAVNFWSVLEENEKQKIHDHCTDHHGMWIQENEDITVFSY